MRCCGEAIVVTPRGRRKWVTHSDYAARSAGQSRNSRPRAGDRMILFYFRWVGFWQAVLDPRSWTQTAYLPAFKSPRHGRSASMEGKDMKFVLVNGRIPRPQSFCALCCESIGESYLREVATRLSFCDHNCYARYSKGLRHIAKPLEWLSTREIANGSPHSPAR
jgi:hypothetical protein